MRIGIVTDGFADLAFEDLLKKCNEIGITDLELGCGNWSSAPHVDLDGLLNDKNKFDRYVELLDKYNINIAALNASGNPLYPGKIGEEVRSVTSKTFQLAEKLGVKKVIAMSGLPGGGPNDEVPNWVISSWPLHTLETVKYQWDQVIPYWEKTEQEAKNHGIEKIALEMHGQQLVYTVENFRHLKKYVGDTIGINLDPSHLFWMQADPIAVARDLGEYVYHAHVKDVRIEKNVCDINTVLDAKGVLKYPNRAWNFAIPGYGHDERWWREFIVVLSMIGYDDVLAIEHEDYTMPAEMGIRKTVDLLKNVMIG